jgi:hypothetical protein
LSVKDVLSLLRIEEFLVGFDEKSGENGWKSFSRRTPTIERKPLKKPYMYIPLQKPI